MLAYNDAKDRMVEVLRRDAHLHGAGRYDEVGAGFDELATSIPRHGAPEFNKLLVALSFWDAWIDDRNRRWASWRGIAENDWPVLAVELAAILEQDHEIVDGRVLRFGHSPFRESIASMSEDAKRHPEIRDLLRRLTQE